MKRVFDQAVFKDLTLHRVITQTHVWRKCVKEGSRPAAVVRCKKQKVNLSVRQDSGRHKTGISEILGTGAIISEISVP